MQVHNSRNVSPTDLIQKMDVPFCSPVRKFEKIERLTRMLRGDLLCHSSTVHKPLDRLRILGKSMPRVGYANNLHFSVPVLMPFGIRTARNDNYVVAETTETVRLNVSLSADTAGCGFRRVFMCDKTKSHWATPSSTRPR